MIQFARLIREICANVPISTHDRKALLESMDLEDGDLCELFDRAHDVWEESKSVHCPIQEKEEVDPKVEYYLQNSGLRCPHCKTSCISAQDIDYNDSSIYQHVICEECGRQWTDEFELTGVDFDDD